MFFCKLFRMEEDNISPNSLGNEQNDSEISEAEPPPHLLPDLGDNSSRNGDPDRLENHSFGASGSNTSSNEVHNREQNPFSFKHFLRSDSGCYQNKGARPKVYSDRRSASNDLVQNRIPESSKQSARMVPEFSSALPDFVQDHLVIEQCYLGNNSSSNYNLEIDNLPDFTHNRDNRNSNSRKVNNSLDSDNLPDCTPNREYRNGNGRRGSNNSNKHVPLDLPGAFPLDLPLIGSSNPPRNSMPSSEVGNSKSLPDFLADSAVCGEALSVPHSPEGELERLRHELDITQRQLVEKNRLCEGLSRELEMARNKEHEYTQSLTKALEQVEENLQKSNRRAAAAENTIARLKIEVKTLTAQIGNLKLENQSLKGEEAAGGHGYYNSTNEFHSQRLAQELRTAAGTAEHSLRQLLTGVDNLRMMAATLENMHRIEERDERFPRFHDDAGPAL